MRLIDIVSGPWAITPAMFSEVQAIYTRHMRGDKINLSDIEARIGGPLNNKQASDYPIENGVAIVSVDGVLSKRMNMLGAISGGASMQIIGNQVNAAAADPAVKAIILHIDSPGGTVDGTQELANIIKAASAQKPVIALADGMMASAAYWIGSAADQVFISSETTTVGSIGVVATHVDISGAEAKEGVKTTEITAGEYKRIASQYAPLTDAGRADIQATVDYFYSIFVDAVAQNRGVSPETVLADMADGRTFIGQQAIDAGLVDGVSTLDQLIASAAAGAFDKAANKTAAKAASAGVARVDVSKTESTTIILKETEMDIQTLKKDFPDLAAALVAEGHAAGMAAGATAERERIQSVEAQAIPGHADLINSLKFDGKTTGPEAAVQVLNAERSKRSGVLADLREDAKPAATVTAAQPADTSAAAGLSVEERCKAQWEKSSSLHAEFASFEDFLAFEQASARGGVKILGAKKAA